MKTCIVICQNKHPLLTFLSEKHEDVSFRKEIVNRKEIRRVQYLLHKTYRIPFLYLLDYLFL